MDKRVFRVGFSGVPCTGKTSTARVLAGVARQKLNSVELVDEYARKFIRDQGAIESIQDQALILDKQVSREDQFNEKIIITDSPIFLGFMYCLDLKTDKKGDELYLNHVFEKMNTLNRGRRYDIIFHLNPVINPHNDGIRLKNQLNDTWREEANNALFFVWKLFPPKKIYIIDETELHKRVDFCMEKINENFSGFTD